MYLLLILAAFLFAVQFLFNQQYRLLKGEGLEESDAALWLCRMDLPLKMECADGYELTVEKVEG